MKILTNSVECFYCGDRLYSDSYNKFVECSCGEVSIAGGTKKLVRFAPEESYIEKSIVETTGKKV